MSKDGKLLLLKMDDKWFEIIDSGGDCNLHRLRFVAVDDDDDDVVVGL